MSTLRSHPFEGNPDEFCGSICNSHRSTGFLDEAGVTASPNPIHDPTSPQEEQCRYEQWLAEASAAVAAYRVNAVVIAAARVKAIEAVIELLEAECERYRRILSRDKACRVLDFASA